MEDWSGVASYGPDGWRGLGEFTSPDKLITLSVDYGEEDFHIDARPGHKPAYMKDVLEQARVRGLEPMDADECEPELLDDGTVRIYLALAEPPAIKVVDLQEKRRQSSAKRMTISFAIAASIAVALLAPSPLRAVYPDMPHFGEDNTAESIPQHYHDPKTQTVHIRVKGD
ncbi:hypothetical protein SEA_TINABELCHER_30 [Streptomyces phage TinaBelcher]|nr:hypothetical protein SEA_TINABELCHER_30 [Streptomyces phage TinaBelcher]